VKAKLKETSMSSNDLMKVLGYLWQEASSQAAVITMATESFSQGYRQKEVQELIMSAVWSTMTPEYFSAFLVTALGENNSFLCLGADTLTEIASTCLWKEIRRRNLEMTVLTVFQQGLVTAQKQCRY
jgi:hypothetical protein